MAMKYIGDIVFSTGEYQDNEGKTKKRWNKIGAAFEDAESGGLSIKLESMPASPEWSGWVKLFRKDNSSSNNQSGYEKAKAQAERLRTDDAPPLSDDDAPINIDEIPF